MTRPKLIRLQGFVRLPEEDARARSEAFLQSMSRRRSVRHFSREPVARDVVDNCLRAAGMSPSGANRQPWHFVVVQDPLVKSQIRAAAEEEERAFYSGRAPDDWLEALQPLGTDERKPFLEDAPCLIVVFAESYAIEPSGDRTKNYYVSESVGIATGILIAALHEAGLATLTHTPSPMSFLNEILGRPKNERPFVLMPVGYPAEDAMVPVLRRKPLEDIVTWI